MKADATFDLGLYLTVLRRRLFLILIPVVVLTAIVGAGSFLLPNIYLVQARVVVRNEQDPIKGLAVDSQITQQLGGVIQNLQRPAAQKEIFDRLERVRPRGQNMDAALRDYRDHLQIEEKHTDRDLIVDILYTGTPEKYCVELVNAFADRFQQEGTKLVASSLTVSLDFIEEQLGDYRKRLGALDDAQRKLEEKLNRDLGDLAPQSSSAGLEKYVADQLVASEAEADKLDLEIQAGDAKAGFLQRQLDATPPTLSLQSGDNAGRAEAELERMLGDARAKRMALKTQYTDQHPQVEALNEQIKELEKRLEEVRGGSLGSRNETPNPDYENLQKELFAVNAELQYSRTRRDQLRARNTKLRGVARRLPAADQEMRRIHQERDALQTTYENLLQRRQSLQLNQSFEQGGNTGRFEVGRAGGVPLRPIRPNRRKIAILGFLGGLFIGISFALLAEYLDHSVRSEADLQRYVPAPVLAVLPRAPD
ncbi:MAG: hypothetical protein HYU66_01060 [Armatimonadetes bacterium]|nr:hypothetical protein [Armatimonadota bacterium]